MAKSGSLGAIVPLEIDRENPMPLHEQIAFGLREAIGKGRLQSGSRLPSTRALSRDWDVSRNTVLHVFETLVSEGLLESRVGDGTYVAEQVDRAPDGEAGVSDIDRNAPAYPFRSLSQRGRNLIAQSQGDMSEKPLPLMPDIPDLRSFPMRSWLRLMNEVSGRLKGNILVNLTNAGYEPLREAIAHHLNLTRHLDCSADQVIITTGSQQSIDLVARLLLERGDPVWVEEPGYMGARAALAANGCTLLPVPADGDGLDVDAGLARYPAPSMIVVSPSRHYPLGGRLSTERRQALLDFSRQSGTWILEDDYDSEFFYVGGPGPALSANDRTGRVLLIGTFSKTLLPSFRLGFIVVPSDLADGFARARSVIDRHPPIFEQLVLSEFIRRGFYAAHLRNMRKLYRERQEVLVAALDSALGYTPPAHELASGMHIVLPMADDADDRRLVRDLQDRGTVARPLSIYYSGRRKQSGLLLGFAAFEADDIAATRASLADLSPSIDRTRFRAPQPHL